MNHGKIGHSFEINAGVAHMRIPGTLGKVIASASTAATRTPDAGSLLAASMTAGTAAWSPIMASDLARTIAVRNRSPGEPALVGLQPHAEPPKLLLSRRAPALFTCTRARDGVASELERVGNGEGERLWPVASIGVRLPRSSCGAGGNRSMARS